MTTLAFQIVRPEPKVWVTLDSYGQNVYYDLICGFDTDRIEELIRDAYRIGLIVHTKTFDTDDLDEAFAIGNGHGDTSKVTSFKPSKSISVGDILVDSDTHVGHMVANFGFIAIYPVIIKEMECHVPQNVIWEETTS